MIMIRGIISLKRRQAIFTITSSIQVILNIWSNIYIFLFRSKRIARESLVEMLVSALAKCIFFVLFLSQHIVKGRTLLSKNPQQIPPTPQLLLTSSSTTTSAVKEEPGKLLTDTISQKVICGNLKTFRKTARKLFNESCKTDSSKGKRNRKERLPEDCVQFTKDRMTPCIKDGLLNEECMEAVLNVSLSLFEFPLYNCISCS